MKMTNKVYDVLKVISMIAVDVSAFVLLVADKLGIENGSTIAAIITAAGALLGTVLIKSSKDYMDSHDPHNEPIDKSKE